MVTVTQTLGIVDMISVEWAEPVSSVLNVVKLLTIDLEILRFNCVAALSMPARYFGKFTMIFVLLAAMAAVHTGFVIKVRAWTGSDTIEAKNLKIYRE